MGGVDDIEVLSDSDDDLNITHSVQKDLGHKEYVKSAPLSLHPYLKLRNDTSVLRSRRQTDLRRIVGG